MEFPAYASCYELRRSVRPRAVRGSPDPAPIDLASSYPILVDPSPVKVGHFHGRIKTPRQIHDPAGSVLIQTVRESPDPATLYAIFEILTVTYF